MIFDAGSIDAGSIDSGSIDSGSIDSGTTLSCSTNETLCGSECVDLQSDSMNCNACGSSCATSMECVNAQCLPTCSGTRCVISGLPFCLDLQTNHENCGACGTTCGLAQQCVNGTCQCPSGQTACGSACVDIQNDPLNCGACGKSCCEGVCSTGICGAPPAASSPIQLTADAGILSWTNGFLPWSCDSYAAAPAPYERSTASGAYLIRSSKGPTAVWCDVAADGGAWTLVARARPNDSVFEYTESDGGFRVADAPSLDGGTFKLADYDINCAKRFALRVDLTGPSNGTRYFKGQCFYAQTDSSRLTSACMTSYADTNWTDAYVGSNPAAPHHSGLSDWHGNRSNGLFIIARDDRFGWFTGDGGDYEFKGTGIQQGGYLLWVK